MLKYVNHARSFVLMQVSDVGERKFSIFLLSGRRHEGGWRNLVGTLRELGVEMQT